MTYFVEMAPAPFCSVLTGVAIEHGKEALTADAAKVDDEGVGVLHRSPRTLVFGKADLVCGIFCCMPI
jgi:hypothetical protein